MEKANTNNAKKVLGICAAIGMAGAVGLSSLALFTDTASTKAETKAGTVNMTITSDAALKDGDFSGQLLNKAFTNEVQNMNPGDSRQLTFNLENTGNKAVYMNDEMTLTVTPDTDYKAEAGAAADIDSVPITIDGMTLEKGKSTFDTETGAYVLVYTGEETVLSGTGDNCEVVADHTDTKTTRNYTLKFDLDAGNFYQDCDIKLNVKADAIQYANTNGLAGQTIVAETTKTDIHGQTVTNG